jgi:hypothetical protein
MTDHPIQVSSRSRGITRLCHVTRSMSLPFIIDKGGLIAAGRLEEEQGAVCYPNGNRPADRPKTHISCSIQYPNVWYLRAIQAREPLFKDWLVLLIDPDPLWWDGSLFCPANAATGGGSYVGAGIDTFESMFETFPTASRMSRGLTHLASCPTDNQAEILVADRIPLKHVQCVVTPDQAQADRERWRMREMNLPTSGLSLAVCPEFFDPRTLSGRIASGVETNPERRPL